MFSKNTIKQTIIVIVLSAIPAFLSYAANSSLIFDKLIEVGVIGEFLDVPLIQDYCLWIGIAISAFGLSLNLLITKIKHEQILEQRNSLIKMNKDFLASSLGRRFLSDTSAFDIRIFIPKHFVWYRICDTLHFNKVKKKFVIKNIDLIAEQGATKNLQFEVEPNQEGLVGLCYKNKALVYDDDLEHTNVANYKLGQHQIARTSKLKWSICCPVCDGNDNVVAIIALDGKTKITIDKSNETALAEEIVVFSRMLYDSVPQLFRR